MHRNQMVRTLRIFWLAILFAFDIWRISRLEKRGGLKPQVTRLYARAGRRMCQYALSMQGLLVKVGQFLSARSDILPLAFTRELSQLLDAVPAASFEQICPILTEALGSDWHSLFLLFEEEAVAAASLGQVHAATLASGETVAVKVRRPGIERLAETDLAALRRVCATLQHRTRFGERMNILALYEEFATTVYEELDYRQEVENLQQFAANFKSDARIVVPTVHESLCSETVIVMEYLSGVRVTDTATYAAWGVSTQHVVDTLLDSYLQQVLVDGFIHVDPHAGNLLVLSDGRIGFLDFGMMSAITKEEARIFARLLLAATARDFDTVVDEVDHLGFLQPHANRAFLKRALAVIVDQLSGIELRKGPELDKFVEDFQTFLREEPLVLQAKFMFLGRAIGMTVGLLNTLNSELQWFDILRMRALPLLNKLAVNLQDEKPTWRDSVAKWVGSVFGDTSQAVTQLLLAQLQETATSTVKLPRQFERVLEKINQDEFTIKLQLDEVMLHLDHQQRLITQAIWALFAGVAGISGVWLQAQRSGFESRIAFGICAMTLLVMLGRAAVIRRRRRRAENMRRRRQGH